ncbi:MAG TPA: calcium-binding protein, partial [Rhodospirillales bacterium]|nr:calcium-binding protein [Rhodospirillales bacterium]
MLAEEDSKAKVKQNPPPEAPPPASASSASKKDDAQVNPNTAQQVAVEQKTEDKKNDEDSKLKGNDQAAVLDIKMFGVEDTIVEAIRGAGNKIGGGVAVAGAKTDQSFAIQHTAETISGTSRADQIYGDNPDIVTKGTSARLLDVKIGLPVEGWVGEQVTISGLPDGYAVVNGVKIKNTNAYVVDLDKADPNHVQLVLKYVIPGDEAEPDANGFLTTFTLTMKVLVDTGGGDYTVISGTQQFAVGNPQNDADMVYTDTATGKTTLVLSRNPAGNTIDAGAGNDEIIASAGSDTIDGGDGVDTASYVHSQSAVTVDLGANTASGGFARNDVLSNIENLAGSDYDDKLTGDAGNNVLSGGLGADTLTGGAGFDTADYELATQAVTVDLASGVGFGGEAQGDVFDGIEAVGGSAFNDSIIGDANANQLLGRDGDDILEGGQGADTLAGGDGWDVADYSDAASGVAVNLLVGTGSAGEAAGDQLHGIEAVYGSAHADTLTGDDDENELLGQNGDDVLAGGLGADTLDGGDGQDTASYALSAAAVTVSLTPAPGVSHGAGFGGDAEGDELHNIENVTGSGFNDRLTGNTGNNALSGGDGADTLIGGAGADTLTGGNGSDIVDYSLSAEGVTVDLLNGVGTGGDAEGDVISGVERVQGSSNTDLLIGSGGSNNLDGGAGNDTLRG